VTFENGRVLDLSEPRIMGILNITPDSFFPGSRFLDIPVALDKALEMLENGAAIIDIGGESSRPGAEKVESKEEIARVLPLIKQLRRSTISPGSGR